MLDVDLLQCWRIGKSVFSAWLLPLGFVGKVAVLRHSTTLSIRVAVVTGAALTLVTWVVVVGVPVPVLVWVAARQVVLNHEVEIERADPFSWIAALLLAAVLAGALDLAVVSLGFTQRLGRRGFWTSVAVNLLCLVVAGYWTTRHILEHPPEA
jgi:hypothetical protein